MKHIKLFENFEMIAEGWMSEIHLVAQEAPNREAFKDELKKMFKGHKNEANITSDEFLEGLAKSVYDKKEELVDESVDAKEIATTILGNRKLRGDITELINGTHAFLVGSNMRVDNTSFKEAIDQVVNKIIDSWEF